MSNTHDENVGGHENTIDLNVFYPTQTSLCNTLATYKQPCDQTPWQHLCTQLRDGSSIDEWLEAFAKLSTSEHNAALAFRAAYCKVHDLTLVGVLRSHSGLEGAYLFNHASLEATSALAALYARTQEAGVKQ